MNAGKTLFAQVMEFVSHYEFRKCVEQYDGDRKVVKFSCWDQFLCLAFAQLTYRESLRDIEASLRAGADKLYHMGISCPPSRNTLANANAMRPWQMWEAFAQSLIVQARRLYADEPFGAELRDTVYALDSTTIDLCLALFPWARFRRHKGAVKLHTLLDLRGSIPCKVIVTHGKTHDVNILDELELEPGAFYLMDRGYLDFGRLYRIELGKAFFVTRAKHNTRLRRLYSEPVDKSTGLRFDQTVVLENYAVKKSYPQKMRRIGYRDLETGKAYVFLTNNFTLPALTIAQLYKCRWQVELFFKWIKQHLRIKKFYGNSANAVKTQVWIAISTYVLVAIMKKRLKLSYSLYTILQILSVMPFEKMPILQALSLEKYTDAADRACRQLNLFD